MALAAASLELKKMSTEKSDTEMDTDSDDECSDYYNFSDDQETDVEVVDPEYFEFKCLTPENVKKDIFIKNAESLCASLPEIKPSVAKLLLHLKGWSTSEIIASYRQNASKLLIDLRIEPPESPKMDLQTFRSCRYFTCSVCFLSSCSTLFHALACGHYFCRHCWQTCFEIQISDGITTTMECMDQGCNLFVPDDFVLNIINNPSSRKKYEIFLFSDYVKHHPQLRFCPGQNCNRLFFAKNVQSKRVVCENCNIQICMKCGSDYHAPADCETMKKWLTKCADDSETANYICANTKDCPKCDVCIEKNGGCNHIRCFHCKHEFCWICLKDWSLHVRDYNCSMYQKPDPEKESVQSRSRKSLQKYLFYFERWENHARSLRLEEQTLQKIKNRIKKKVLANEGTWIDWQYLIDAADLLAKCRYTICYTYPYAFFMESSPDLILFEYQQAQLEAEIEDLSWKIERAETTDKGDLINKMYVAEKKRTILLKDFLAV